MLRRCFVRPQTYLQTTASTCVQPSSTVTARVTGLRYDLDEVHKKFIQSPVAHRVLMTYPWDFKTSQLKARAKPIELIAFESEKSHTHFFMREGVHVAWGATQEEMAYVEKTLGSGVKSELELGAVAIMHTTPGAVSSVDTEKDCFVLGNNDILSKVPFSYALAQSALIDAAMATIQPVNSDVSAWNRGESFNIQDMRQKNARMMLVAFDALSGKALDKPQFFWDVTIRGSLEELYKDAREHLEIERRKAFLEERLQHILESMKFLRSEHHTALAHRLDWVIVALITISASITLTGDFLRDNHTVAE